MSQFESVRALGQRNPNVRAAGWVFLITLGGVLFLLASCAATMIADQHHDQPEQMRVLTHAQQQAEEKVFAAQALKIAQDEANAENKESRD